MLDLCSVTDTLIRDGDGIYYPALPDDRLILGLRGTMSEAELHVMQARLQGGAHNKASGSANKLSEAVVVGASRVELLPTILINGRRKFKRGRWAGDFLYGEVVAGDLISCHEGACVPQSRGGTSVCVGA